MTETTLFCSEVKCNRDRTVGSDYCILHANQQHATPAPIKGPSSFDLFAEGVKELIEGKAREKGYNESGEGKNDLMDFTNKFFPGHAGGEIVYKAIRYGRKRDKADLLKIAAWAYLLWKHDR